MVALPNTKSFEHLLRMMVIAEVSKEGRRTTCESMEIPDDGVAISMWASSKAEEDPSSRAFAQQWFQEWSKANWMDVIHFEQGGLGHPMRRPTVMVTNMDITELKGVRDERKEEAEWGSRSTWAPMMAHVLVRGWKRWKLRPGWYPRIVKSVKAIDRKAWERHLANDHVPHRPDCLQCIHNSTGRPHRKCLHKDCYVMSADTLGPVRIAGPKGEKFAVVFTYQYPKQKLSPEDKDVPEEDLAGWDLDVKDVAAEQDKFPTEDDEAQEDYSPDGEARTLCLRSRWRRFGHSLYYNLPWMVWLQARLRQAMIGGNSGRPKAFLFDIMYYLEQPCSDPQLPMVVLYPLTSWSHRGLQISDMWVEAWKRRRPIGMVQSPGPEYLRDNGWVQQGFVCPRRRLRKMKRSCRGMKKPGSGSSAT